MINRFLRRLTLRGRLVSLVILLLAIFTGMFILLIGNQISLAERVQQITNVDGRAERLLLLASVRVLSARVNTIRYVNEATPNPNEAISDINQAQDLLEQAQSLLIASEQAEEIEATLVGMDEYITLIGKLQATRSEGSNNEMAALLSDVYQKELELEQRIESIVTENSQRLEATNQAIVSDTQRRMAFVIAGFITAVILSIAGVVVVERSILAPVNELLEGAEALQNGHLEGLVPVTGQDELSGLVRKFNQMAAQIAKSYSDLEQQVVVRTRALESRALQLQVAAEVARVTASVEDLNTLLHSVVNLIRERFSYYHVNIYLIDDLGKYAVLRAATGEAGHSLIQREHKLRVGEMGIVGYVTGVGVPRILNDVESDFVYRRDVMLPETQAEMAVPLKAGNVVVGALDIQSSKRNAFSEEDLATIQILADQLAVAIKNVRLESDLKDRLSEINTLYRRYTQESLARVRRGSQQLGYQYDLFSIQAAQQKLSQDVRDKLKAGEKVVIQEETQGVVKSRLLAPLMLYDQMIGVLGFEDDDPKHEWSTDEIVIIEAVSNQVILALDNASLLDETQLRTDQLRLLQDITAAAASHTRLSELLEDVSQKLRAGLDVERCMISLMNTEGMLAIRKAIASAHPLHPEAFASSNKIQVMEIDLIQQAITQKKSVVRYKEEGLPLQGAGMDLPSQPVIHAKVVIPLTTRESVVGLIELDVADSARQFGEDDLQLFDQLSLQISSAIEVTRSIEQTSIRAEQERMVSEVTARMRATLDVESVMRTAVDEIFQTGDYAEVSIYLATEDGVEQ